MAISATIIADSVSEEGNRITTMHLVHHRYILPELNTHRAFSRNGRSSRAVPTVKLLEEVRANPAISFFAGKNMPGMQAGEPMRDDERVAAIRVWKDARDDAVRHVERLYSLGCHKQDLNRLLEPFLWQHTLVTSTEWDNFFALRYHADAQPEMQALAKAMYEAMQASKPVLLKCGEWHLPYIREDDRKAVVSGFDQGDYWDTLLKISTARCARVSYEPFDGNGSIAAELDRYASLMGAQPIHASPAEHQATPDVLLNTKKEEWGNPHLHGNFVGWAQHRRTIRGHTVTKFTSPTI